VVSVEEHDHGTHADTGRILDLNARSNPRSPQRISLDADRECRHVRYTRSGTQRSPSPKKDTQMIKDILLVAVGFLAGGVTCALSAKMLGWFNKETKSVAAKLP
jgi:hypothetical protein